MNPPTSDLTWPALLAHWTSVAQASVALPKNAEGERWRSAVAPVIGLQAVTFALADLDRLAAGAEEELPGARAAAIDKAEVIVRLHATELHGLWRGEAMPGELDAIVSDARLALGAARESGVEWTVTAESVVADHPGDVLGILVSAGFKGDLYLPVPGSILFQGSPCAFARGKSGEKPGAEVLRAVKEFLVEVSKPTRVRRMRQVYRQFDFGTGKIRRDLVVPMNVAGGGGLVAGQAQLIPVIERGAVQQVNLPIPGMANVKPVPVEFVESAEEGEVG
jgi:hypothetical protein